MRVEPRNDFVFVRETRETVSSGGIILVREKRPWAARDGEHKQGTVVSVGPGRHDKRGRRESMWGIEEGQEIAFSPNGNFVQEVDGEVLTVIRRDSVIGIVEGRRAQA